MPVPDEDTRPVSAGYGAQHACGAYVIEVSVLPIDVSFSRACAWAPVDTGHSESFPACPARRQTSGGVR